MNPLIHLSIQRVLEAAVIAGVLAVFAYLMLVPRLEDRIAQVRDDIADLKRKVEFVEVQRNIDYRDLTRQINLVSHGKDKREQ